MNETTTWVVGAGGLLGANAVQAQRRRGPVWTLPAAVPWGTETAGPFLDEAAHAFARDISATGNWQIAWCAGAGVTGTTREQLAAETALFKGFLESLTKHISESEIHNGAFFLASSAGGVYAGAAGPPFDEHTPPRSISPYGDAKLELEAEAARWGSQNGVPVVLGRIANLYGPGQNLAKPQGLLSQIIKAHLLREPLSIYVSLDTLRDYIYAPDCGNLVLDSLDWVREVSQQTGPSAHAKVLASQQAVTIGTILGELRRVFKRPPKIIYGASPNAKFQIRDLRLRSVAMPELNARPLTPLPAGFRATVDGLTRTLQAGRL